MTVLETGVYSRPDDAYAAQAAIGDVSKVPGVRLMGDINGIEDVDEFTSVSRAVAELLLKSGPIELTVEVKRA
jgi:hypothetical protein